MMGQLNTWAEAWLKKRLALSGELPTVSTGLIYQTFTRERDMRSSQPIEAAINLSLSHFAPFMKDRRHSPFGTRGHLPPPRAAPQASAGHEQHLACGSKSSASASGSRAQTRSDCRPPELTSP